MSIILRIFLLCAEVIYFAVLFSFLKKKNMTIRYSIIWLILGVAMVVFTAFPILMVRIVRLFGVQSQMNGLFGILIFFLMLMLLSMTSIVSKQTDSIRKLTQENALLEERVRKLESRNNKDKKEQQINNL